MTDEAGTADDAATDDDDDDDDGANDGAVDVTLRCKRSPSSPPRNDVADTFETSPLLRREPAVNASDTTEPGANGVPLPPPNLAPILAAAAAA